MWRKEGSTALLYKATMGTMSRQANSFPAGANQSLLNHIRLKGHLGREWADWFEGLTITALDNGDTLLSGTVIDQVTLHGLFRKMRDLGMQLLSAMHIEPEQANVLHVTP